MHSHSSSTYKSYCWTAHDVWQVFPAEKCCLHYTCVPYTCSGSFKPFLPFSDKTKLPQNDIKQNIILTWISQLDSLHDWNFVNVDIIIFHRRQEKKERQRKEETDKSARQRSRERERRLVTKVDWPRGDWTSPRSSLCLDPCTPVVHC